MIDHRFRPPRGMLLGALLQRWTASRRWQALRRGVMRRLPFLKLASDVRDVVYLNWVVDVAAVAMGGLYSKLFHLELSEHLPYVTLGLIIWNMLNASILEGADVFIANEGLIKQLPTPLSVHVYRLVWRQMILFLHNIVIYVIIAIIFPKPWSLADLAAVPALLLIMLNCVWVSICCRRRRACSIPTCSRPSRATSVSTHRARCVAPTASRPRCGRWPR